MKLILCACGCGLKRNKFDSQNREYRYIKGHTKFWLGKKRPDYFKGSRKITYGKDNIFSRIKFSGEKHSSWKGGRWPYWRRKALQRDNFTCQKCGFREDLIMQVDHIVPVKGANRYKINHDLNNLMTLCPNCHARKTKTQWIESRQK